jgi:hypothetical protein
MTTTMTTTSIPPALGNSTFTIQIQELNRPENIYILPVKWFSSIKDIKDQLKFITNTPPREQHLFHLARPTALKNSQSLHDLGIEKEGHILKLSINTGTSNFVLTSSTDYKVDENCLQMINNVRLGLQRNQKPIATEIFDCTGGVYFLRNSLGQKCAVFKPNDEEQGMPHNNKGHVGLGDVGLRPHFKPGQGCVREYAAYILDVDNFCGVPATALVHFEHPIFNYPPLKLSKGVDKYPKFGSLQQFINARDTFDDIGASVLSDFEVQKIALLDLRLLNCDRNASNILAILTPHSPKANNGFKRNQNRSYSMSSHDSTGGESAGEDLIDFDDDIHMNRGSGSYSLYPIDHGYCLPPKLFVTEMDWAWFDYPQISRPICPEIKEYMLSLDLEKSIDKLTSCVSISEDSLFNFRLAHHLLVEGIKNGLNLKEMSSLIARLDEDTPSRLEKTIAEAEDNAHRTSEMKSVRLESSKKPNLTKSLKSTPSLENKYGNPYKRNSKEIGSNNNLNRLSVRNRRENDLNDVEITDITNEGLLNNQPSEILNIINSPTGCTSCDQSDSSPRKYGSQGSTDSNGDSSNEVSPKNEINYVNELNKINNSWNNDNKLIDLPDFQNDDIESIKKSRSIEKESLPLPLPPFLNFETTRISSCKSESINPNPPSNLTPPPSFDIFLKRLNSLPQEYSTPTLLSSTTPPMSTSSSSSNLVNSNLSGVFTSPEKPENIEHSPIVTRSAGKLTPYHSKNDGGDYTDSDGGGDADGETEETLQRPRSSSLLRRVASFGAFDNAPIYDNGNSERVLSRLQRERRRELSSTTEFGRLRLLFAGKHVSAMINKVVKTKKEYLLVDPLNKNHFPSSLKVN